LFRAVRDEAGAAVVDRIAIADCVGHDGRQAGRHGLDQRQRHAFPVGGLHIDGRLRKFVTQLRRPEPARQ
jgi:hypothetical protein